MEERFLEVMRARSVDVCGGVDICLWEGLSGVGAACTAGGICRRDWAQACTLTHDVPRFGALMVR